MNPIAITVTGRLGDDPRPFTTRDGTDGVELRLALEIPARGAGDSMTRWVKVVAFGLLATRTAESVHRGDRVTVTADDLTAEAWAARDNGEPRARSPSGPATSPPRWLRHPPHRLRRPQGRPRRCCQRRAPRPPGPRAGRGPRDRRGHHLLAGTSRGGHDARPRRTSLLRSSSEELP